MTIQEWTLLVEVVGAVGIIVTLIYLAMQVRQATNQARADNHRDVANRWIEAQNSGFRSREGAELICRALNDYESLDTVEKGQFHAFMLDILSAYQAVHELYVRKLVNQDYFLGIERVLVGYMKSPGAADYWRRTTQEFPPVLVGQVESAIKAHERPPLTETMPYLEWVNAKTRE